MVTRCVSILVIVLPQRKWTYDASSVKRQTRNVMVQRQVLSYKIRTGIDFRLIERLEGQICLIFCTNIVKELLSNKDKLHQVSQMLLAKKEVVLQAGS